MNPRRAGKRLWTKEFIMSLGNNWRTALVHQHQQTDLRTKAEEQEVEEARGKALVASIPNLVAQAAENGKQSVEVYQYVAFCDVAGTHKDRVDQLFDKRGSRALESSDLVGKARIIHDYCTQHDLECFLVPEKIPLNDYEYIFCIRPKSK